MVPESRLHSTVPLIGTVVLFLLMVTAGIGVAEEPAAKTPIAEPGIDAPAKRLAIPLPTVTCPRDIYAWIDDPAPWPLDPVTLGGQSYGRDVLSAMIDDEDLEEDDASVALAAELVAAKLNRARGVIWEPADDLIADGDAALASGGALPQSIVSDTQAAEQPLQLAGSLAAYNSGEEVSGCPLPSGSSDPAVGCPLRAADWAVRSSWPLSSIVLGGRSYTRSSIEDLMAIADPGLSAPKNAALVELAAAKLNQASGVAWSGLDGLISGADNALVLSDSARSVDTCSSMGITLGAEAAKLQTFNAGRTLGGCLPEGGSLADLAEVGSRALEPRRCQGVWGFAELHTHMFAEFGWNQQFIEGSIGDPNTPGADPASHDLARCSGLWDHASLRFPYIVGMGVTTEELVAVKQNDGSGKSSPGDTGLHLGRRNGFDDRTCHSACLGPGTCIFKGNEADCLAADPGFCKDDIPNNVSVSALIACNTKTSRTGCESAGYCGATGSSLWSITDDLDPCWANWPNCDAGDTCLKRDPLKLLECNDLNQTECNNHSAECDWDTGCKLQSGSFTCGDLSNQTDCSQYGSWCNWDPGNCSKDPLVLAGFECSDLDQNDCNYYGECGWKSECVHVSGSLTCSDLSKSECKTYSECSWIFGKCRNHLIGGSLTCSDLSQAHCGNHSECQWQSFCDRTSGSFTCGDLNNQADCNQYGYWCDWDPANCYKDPLVLAPFECNDLDQNDCNTYSECGWEEKCTHPITAPTLECSDLTPEECANHWEDGGCGMRDCEPVRCEWNDWGECRWDNVWPPHCGEHFRDWPAWDTPTHQQHWWGHLQDAWRKGLRIVSASILEVDPLGTLMPGGTDRTPYQVIIDQLDAAHAFDADHDWVEIALSAEHAREIAERGDLAMVLTLEANFPFCKDRPCGVGSDEEDITNVLATLDEFVARGVRGYQVMSHFDNPFAGVAVYTQAIHLMQWLYEELNTDGDVTSLEMAGAMNIPLADAFAEAADIAQGWDPLATVPVLGSLFPVTSYDDITDLHALMALAGGISGVECVRRDNGAPERCATCLKDGIACQNVRGLTPLGEELVRGLIDRRVMLDIAHLSELGVQGVWDVVQSYAPGGTYPLYVSHGDPREALPIDGHKGPHQEKPSPQWILDIVDQSGGMFGMRTGPDTFLDHGASLVPNDCAGSSKSFAQAVGHLVDAGVEVGFALDMNGMIANAVPRFIDDGSRKTRRRGQKAACLGEEGEQDLQTGMLVDDPSTPHTDESRYNSKGLGHIGLLGAYLDDLENQGLSQTYLDHLYGSAEAFIRMWEAVP